MTSGLSAYNHTCAGQLRKGARGDNPFGSCPPLSDDARSPVRSQVTRTQQSQRDYGFESRTWTPIATRQLKYK